MSKEMITFRVTREQKAKLESLAKQRGCSISDVIRAWIDGIQTESTIKLCFKTTRHLTEYHSMDLDFLSGQVQEVPENRAIELLTKFPDNFDIVKNNARFQGQKRNSFI
jgi:uncharacterized protein (DUF1778 family)